jgi:hypothetical protein
LNRPVAFEIVYIARLHTIPAGTRGRHQLTVSTRHCLYFSSIPRSNGGKFVPCVDFPAGFNKADITLLHEDGVAVLTEYSFFSHLIQKERALSKPCFTAT